MTRPTRISGAQARRIAIAAVGLDGALPGERGRAGARTLERAIGRLGLLQLDSVNVFERSHYLPLLSRLGPYDRRALDRLLHHDHGRGLGAYTEYLAHEAAVIPVADWPLWGWRRRRPLRGGGERWAAEHATLIDDVRAEFAERGPMRPSDMEHPAHERLPGGWWNKSDAYWATAVLFQRGELVTVGRSRFERRYAVADGVLPDAARAEVDARDAQRELVARAAAAYGVATLDDLADYHRLPVADTKVAAEALVDAGELEQVEVEGWGRPAFRSTSARSPRRVRGTALLSPFDPLVWHRPRAERLFGFEYRISIYTPAAQRAHGYYVLPVLIDDHLVGRVDLKSDRRAGVLRVQHATIEPAHEERADELAARLAPALHEAAAWQGLDRVEVAGPGTWARAVAAAL
ncbi:winged helix-turn-helix domain-containing protein [Agrococcus sp. HG114]|uniref:winged helix-turn-helix domain-containing protein n=1 Tax=Agrococcus sp. HG114 TaxID=2969757 RepID=UPI00215A6B13|nr:crosslink repair DNA glycosylase YcaQ family protein [Agrococcus sp. HG114]MCR8671658.1 winged helix DNA-binding domain-containing protein [Agrococcus sp. HG114]